MKIAVSGSTGFVGQQLVKSLEKEGHEVTALVREDFMHDASTLANRISGVEGIIHLAGAPIIKRWNEKHKERIYHSRIDTTRLLTKAIKSLKEKPGLFISTSAIGIYSSDFDRVHTEETYEYGETFLAKVCKDWEAEAYLIKPFTRFVIFRFGVVLGKNGGALKQMLPLFKAGLGGKIGSGKQGFSWIHIDDLLKAYHFVINNKEAEGIFNLTAPQPVSNKEFTEKLAKVLKRPAIFSVPEAFMKMIYGEGAQMLTSGQYVRPRRLISHSFKFEYPTVEKALKDIVSK
ncbi:MAG: TIGR01777 family oxidoreductase [Bacteroidales bacterium]|nr:TIGR01777 family oxidoreductase [Bacteroidales bacterium]MCF8334821.1 TIGR01777 family oxidoreductase [Bacteroidales bacterium]